MRDSPTAFAPVRSVGRSAVTRRSSKRRKSAYACTDPYGRVVPSLISSYRFQQVSTPFYKAMQNAYVREFVRSPTWSFFHCTPSRKHTAWSSNRKLHDFMRARLWTLESRGFRTQNFGGGSLRKIFSIATCEIFNRINLWNILAFQIISVYVEIFNI